MQLDELLWIILPFFVAIGTSVLVWMVMEARMTSAVAKERAIAAEARSQLESHERAFAEKSRAIEENAKRQALDEFYREIRVEERRYLRKNMAGLGGDVLIVQERISFRGLPLTAWTNHVIEAGSGEEIEQLPSPGRLLEAAAPRPHEPAEHVRAEPARSGTWETGPQVDSAQPHLMNPQVMKMDVASPMLFLDETGAGPDERSLRRRRYSGGLQLLHLDQFAYGDPPEGA